MDTIRHIPLSDMSNTLPDQCEDWLVRFYNRGNEKEFENLSKLFTLGEKSTSTSRRFVRAPPQKEDVRTRSPQNVNFQVLI